MSNPTLFVLNETFLKVLINMQVVHSYTNDQHDNLKIQKNLDRLKQKAKHINCNNNSTELNLKYQFKDAFFNR